MTKKIFVFVFLVFPFSLFHHSSFFSLGHFLENQDALQKKIEIDTQIKSRIEKWKTRKL